MPWPTTTALRWGKRPIWLFEFTRNGTTTFLTSHAEDYTDGNAQLWTQTNIAKSRVRKTSVGERAAVTLTFPKSNAFAQTFRDDLSYDENRLTIYHEFRGVAGATRTKFIGRVIALQETILTISLIAENDFTLLRGRGTSTILQKTCRHAVYGQTVDGYGCGASLAANQVASTISAMASSTIVTVAAASSLPDGYYNSGVLTWNGIDQRIAKHTGTTLELHRPMSGLVTAFGTSGSEAVLIAQGCPGTRHACENRFGNLPNHGGFPWSQEYIGDGRTLF